MTIEENTIKYLKSINEWGQNSSYIETAISALEKQMPKKPTMYDSIPHARCPKCHCAVMIYCDDAKHPNCHWCGQAIDWGEEE